MRIEVNRLAAVRHANIEIDGITVIAGPNDTGKSTISKALWCMFDSFYKYERQFESYREDALEDAVKSLLPRAYYAGVPRVILIKRIVRNLQNEWEAIRVEPSSIAQGVLSAYAKTAESVSPDELPIDSEGFERLCNEVALIASYDDARLMCGVLNNNFLSEFTEQPSNVDDPDHDAQVSLIIQGRPVSATISNNHVGDISSLIHLDVRAIYIDDAFIVDEVAYGYRYGRSVELFDEDRHQRLRRLLGHAQRSDGNVLREMMASDQISRILKQVERALPGDLSWKNPRELNYVPAGYSNPINARNVSAGMKVFSILKLLLQNGVLERKSTIILDEPEVHLHPEWQLVFAELIVLLQRTYELHVLLTTHSPYFLRAIQVYAAKYSMATRCRYYRAERRDKWCEIHDVTYSTEEIFDSLVRPFERLEAEEYRV